MAGWLIVNRKRNREWFDLALAINGFWRSHAVRILAGGSSWPEIATKCTRVPHSHWSDGRFPAICSLARTYNRVEPGWASALPSTVRHVRLQS
jgi:hypothetical protein